MDQDTLFTAPHGALLAAASPGSAGAYSLGRFVLKAMLAQRTIALEKPAAGRVRGLPRWLDRILDRLDQYAWGHESRQREAYLSSAQNLADLERRMRLLERNPDFMRQRNPL